MSQDNRRSCNWCGKRYKESSAHLSRYYCSRRCELIAQQRDPDNYEACLKANRIIRIAKWIFYTLVALGIIFGSLNTNADTDDSPISENDLHHFDEELDAEDDQRFSERSKIHINDQAEKDSIENRKQFIRDSIDRRIKFVRDSLAQIAEAKEIQEQQFQQWLVNIRNTYINSFVPEGMPWELKRKDGSIIFSDEWDINTSRYQYKLACLATQSGENTGTKVFGFSSKCQKEIIGYYNGHAPKIDQCPY